MKEIWILLNPDPDSLLQLRRRFSLLGFTFVFRRHEGNEGDLGGILLFFSKKFKKIAKNRLRRLRPFGSSSDEDFRGYNNYHFSFIFLIEC